MQDWGLQQVSALLMEVALMQAGVPYEKLGISERRHASEPELVMTASEKGTDRVLIGYRNYTTFKSLVEADTPPGSIAHFKLSGVMRAESSASTRGVDALIQDLRFAYSNKNIDGIVLQVNSGGGDAMAAFQLRNAIQERNKPVVALVDYAGSGAVLSTANADEIIAAHEGTQVGGIGAFISINKKALAEYAETYVDVYSDDAPDKNKPVRDALNGDFTAMKGVVNKVSSQFRQVVMEGRQLKGSPEYIEKTLSGGMFDTAEAKRRGLVDLSGNLQTAVRRIDYMVRRAKKQTV